MKLHWNEFSDRRLIWAVGACLLVMPTVQLNISDTYPTTKLACSISEDVARGRAWASTCKGCHDISPTENDLQHSSGGPNLQRVYMSLAGTQHAPINPTAAYHYPYPPLAAARDAGVVWTEENLLAYLRDPKGFLDRKSGKDFGDSIFYMNFFIGQERDRRDVIAYLKAIKYHPECD